MMYVRGIIVRARSALPSVCMGCTILLSVVRKHKGNSPALGYEKSIRSPNAWLKAAPPSSRLSPVSELVSLPRPCLPRMEVFGGGVFTGERM